MLMIYDTIETQVIIKNGKDIHFVKKVLHIERKKLYTEYDGFPGLQSYTRSDRKQYRICEWHS